jgi:hypothetical protein
MFLVVVINNVKLLLGTLSGTVVLPHKKRRERGEPCFFYIYLRSLKSYTTGKTVIAVRHFLCRMLSIGRTAKVTLCRALRTSRTAQINARWRRFCRASKHGRTTKIYFCRAFIPERTAKVPGTCAARATADGGARTLTVVSLCRAPCRGHTAKRGPVA